MRGIGIVRVQVQGPREALTPLFSSCCYLSSCVSCALTTHTHPRLNDWYTCWNALYWWWSYFSTYTFSVWYMYTKRKNIHSLYIVAFTMAAFDLLCKCGECEGGGRTFVKSPRIPYQEWSTHIQTYTCSVFISH